MMRIFLFFTMLLGLLAFSACNNEHSVEADDFSGFLAGFIEFDGNYLHITAVDVFVLFDEEIAQGHEVFLNSTEHILRSDYTRLNELGLTLDDFVSWTHIRPNYHADYGFHYIEQAGIETLSFRIDEDAEFTFVDADLLFGTEPDGNRVHISYDLSEFMHYFRHSIVHFIEVREGRVIRLVQEILFAI